MLFHSILILYMHYLFIPISLILSRYHPYNIYQKIFNIIILITIQYFIINIPLSNPTFMLEREHLKYMFTHILP